MLGRIFTVGGYTLLSRVTGLARDIMLAAILGAGPLADAFLVAWRLPNNFPSIFAFDHAGDALWRHAQCDAPVCQRGRGLDLSQHLDDGDAGAGGVLSDRRPRRGLGRPDFRFPAIFPFGRRSRPPRQPAALRA